MDGFVGSLLELSLKCVKCLLCSLSSLFLMERRYHRAAPTKLFPSIFPPLLVPSQTLHPVPENGPITSVHSTISIPPQKPPGPFAMENRRREEVVLPEQRRPFSIVQRDPQIPLSSLDVSGMFLQDLGRRKMVAQSVAHISGGSAAQTFHRAGTARIGDSGWNREEEERGAGAHV